MRSITLLIVALVSGVFVSCNTESNKKNIDRLIGEWVIFDAEGSLKEINLETHYAFNGKTMSTFKDDFTTEGPYIANDSIVNWSLENMELTYNYHFENNTLIIIPKGGDQKFLLKRI